MERYYEARYRLLAYLISTYGRKSGFYLYVGWCFPGLTGWGGRGDRREGKDPIFPLSAIKNCEWPHEGPPYEFSPGELCEALGIPTTIYLKNGRWPKAWPPPPETLSQLVGQYVLFGRLQVMHEGEKHLVTFITWEKKESIVGQVLTQEDVELVRNICLCPSRFFALDR